MLERMKIDPELDEQSWDTKTESVMVDKPSNTEMVNLKKRTTKNFKKHFEKELRDAAGV